MDTPQPNTDKKRGFKTARADGEIIGVFSKSTTNWSGFIESVMRSAADTLIETGLKTAHQVRPRFGSRTMIGDLRPTYLWSSVTLSSKRRAAGTGTRGPTSNIFGQPTSKSDCC